MADLVTLSDALNHLGLDEDGDGRLAKLVTRVSALVRRYTGRAYAASARTEYLTGGGPALVLSYPPVDEGETITVRDLVGSPDADEAATDYDVDPVAGLVYRASDGVPVDARWPTGVRRWLVTYTGGTATVDDDVKLATLEWIADKYIHADPGATAEKLGDYSVTREAGMPSSVRETLDDHRLETW